jgi:hypothetical protein
VLIRPDGYVAAVADTADLGGIETYLDTVGIRPLADRISLLFNLAGHSTC